MEAHFVNDEQKARGSRSGILGRNGRNQIELMDDVGIGAHDIGIDDGSWCGMGGHEFKREKRGK